MCYKWIKWFLKELHRPSSPPLLPLPFSYSLLFAHRFYFSNSPTDTTATPFCTSSSHKPTYRFVLSVWFLFVEFYTFFFLHSSSIHFALRFLSNYRAVFFFSYFFFVCILFFFCTKHSFVVFACSAFICSLLFDRRVSECKKKAYRRVTDRPSRRYLYTSVLVCVK